MIWKLQQYPYLGKTFTISTGETPTGSYIVLRQESAV